jgi:hypothetical protein
MQCSFCKVGTVEQAASVVNQQPGMTPMLGTPFSMCWPIERSVGTGYEL